MQCRHASLWWWLLRWRTLYDHLGFFTVLAMLPPAPLQFMATVHTEPDGRRVLYVKGAPDRLMPLCKSQLIGAGDVTQTAPLDPSFWQHAQAGLSSKGLRVLALCRWGDGGRRMNFKW